MSSAMRILAQIFDPVLKAQAKKSALASDPDASLSPLEWVVAILCSGIGCIVGIVYLVQGKPKGKKMLIVSICAQIIWGLLRVAAENAINH